MAETKQPLKPALNVNFVDKDKKPDWDKKALFYAACREKGKAASEVLNEYIDVYIKKSGITITTKSR